MTLCLVQGCGEEARQQFAAGFCPPHGDLWIDSQEYIRFSQCFDDGNEARADSMLADFVARASAERRNGGAE